VRPRGALAKCALQKRLPARLVVPPPSGIAKEVAELRSLGATSDALVSQPGAARASGWPRVDLQGELTSASPNARYIPQTDSVRTTWSVGVQISLSPNDALSAACVARAIEAKQTGLLHQRRALQEGLRVEIALALEARGNAALAQVSTTRGLEAANEAYRIRKISFGLGRTPSLDLRDAEREVTRARFEAMGARVAEVELNHALGRDVR
jgi:outer membrane protein TolC